MNRHAVNALKKQRDKYVKILDQADKIRENDLIDKLDAVIALAPTETNGSGEKTALATTRVPKGNPEKVLAYVKEHPNCLSREVGEALGIPAKSASACLRYLHTTGAVTKEKVGKSRSVPLRWTAA